MSRITLTAASRIGRVRNNNEDMVLAFNKFIRSDIYATEFLTENTDRFAIAIADGMGGHKAGEVASSDVLSNLHFFLNDLPRDLSVEVFKQMLVDWLHSVCNIIESKGQLDPSMSDMGTTLVGVIYYCGNYYWINCGDSRLYRYRNGELKQLTTDHSLNQMLGDNRHSNIITNCIGAGCKDSYLDITLFTDDFKSGDVYLLCSDGLNDMINDSAIKFLLSKVPHANDLCEAAIEAGGYDNVSVCVFKVE